MDSQYWVLTLNNVSAEREDEITGYLFENGASGVQENLNYTQLDRHYQPHVIEQEVKSLIVYFENPVAHQFLQDLSLRFNVEAQFREEQNRDWLKEWKDQWNPFCLTDNLWIVPDWHKESFDSSGKKVIYIEPGMAFGTGTHETTQIASELIVNLVSKNKVESALDVGTGSGILAMILGLYKVPNIWAYDNDPESHRVFHENIAKNSQESLQWCETWSQSLNGKVSLTIANIIDGVLLDLKPQFQSMESSYYIFTGVLSEREDMFLQEMLKDWSLELLERRAQGEWVGFCFARKL